MAEYPSTTYEAEALYVLYLSNEGPTKTSFRSQLVERYPSSYFKTMILKLENGTLAENKEILAQKKYEAAFERFEAGQFAASYEACLFVQQNYPGSKLEDKIVFLSALCQAGLKNPTEYLKILKQFVQLFPLSPLKAEAEARINAIPKNN